MIREVYEIRTPDFVNALKSTFKNNTAIKMPENHDIIKTGTGKENCPVSDDWYYARMAAVVNLIAKKGGVTVDQLAVEFGNYKNRGRKPNRFHRANTSIINSLLENLSAIGYIDINNQDDMLTEKAKEVVYEIISSVKEE